MHNVIRRAAVAAGAVVVVLGTWVGVAAASTSDPVLAFTPSPYDYGQVTVGQTATQTFTLANTGGKASSALAVTVPGSATFTITADTCTGTSLGPGKSCTVTVQFAPASTRTVTATLTAVSQRPGVVATDSLTGTSGRHLYWTDVSGTINEANLDGTGVTTLVTDQGGPFGVAVSPQ